MWIFINDVEVQDLGNRDKSEEKFCFGCNPNLNVCLACDVLLLVQVIEMHFSSKLVFFSFDDVCLR